MIERFPMVEFQYDQAVHCPADSVGAKGEVKMLPVPLAFKLRDRGIGRLTSDIKAQEERERQEKEDVGQAAGVNYNSGQDNRSDDGGKKKAVRSRRSRKSVDSPAGSA
jgi:hypothetical protein